jgi:hypothetical protein
MIVGMKAEVDERVEVRAGFEVDGPAVAAVPAVGAAAGDELLPAEAHAPAATIPSADPDVDFVDEHRWLLNASGERPCAIGIRESGAGDQAPPDSRARFP